eukprot:TRINITY_DN94119_c0_g1_i1.p1 TRINITY_DN94119_c0_g1~~TRINITY_DN94119_c0_g1_i1.p1  ORF type:complete len:532 (+),score=201.06 TRINITY_DN94119_c0_g1_i1:173-1768(+)
MAPKSTKLSGSGSMPALASMGSLPGSPLSQGGPIGSPMARSGSAGHIGSPTNGRSGSKTLSEGRWVLMPNIDEGKPQTPAGKQSARRSSDGGRRLPDVMAKTPSAADGRRLGDFPPSPLAADAAIDADMEFFPVKVLSREEATEALKAAVSSKDMEELAGALQQARASKVDRKQVEDAYLLLQQLECTAELTRAKKDRNGPALQSALARGKQFEVDSSLLKESEALFQVVDAEERLRIAMEVQESGFLRLAIQTAQGIGVPGRVLEEPKRVLSQLEAKRNLLSLLKSKNVTSSQIKDAIKKAEQTGVTEELEEARRYQEELEQFEKEKEQPRNKKVDHHEDLEGLIWSAIETGETGALQHCIKMAHANGIQGEVLAAAEKVLAQQLARRALATVMKQKNPNVKQLKEAVIKGEDSALPEEELAFAKQIIEAQEVRELLSAAITSKDLHKLEAVIPRAVSSGADRSKIEKAQKMLVTLQAKAMLETAIQSGGDVDLLKEALGHAKVAGVDRKLVDKAEALMKPELPRLVKRT